MKREAQDWFRPVGIAVFALLLSLALLLIFLGGREGAKGARPRGLQPLVVKASTVTPQTLTAKAHATGLLEPIRDITLFAETQGQVSSRPVEEDDPVKTGDLVLGLDDTYKRTALARAEAAVAEARSVALLQQAQSKRARELYRTKTISPEELDRQLSQETVAAAALRVAEQRLREAREDLEKTLIRSPIDGTVVELPFERFEFVKAGEPVARIIDGRELKLVVEVSDRERVGLRRGVEAEIEVDAFPGRKIKGVTVRVGEAASAGTKKFPLEIHLDNREGLLLPGMVAEASVPLSTERRGIILPKELVLESFGQHYVYLLVTKNSGLTAKRTRIAIRSVPFLPTHVEVTDGLREGDRVIGTELQELRDGAAVRLQPGEGAD